MIKIISDESDIALRWFITKFCNFNCSFCIESNVKRKWTKEELEVETLRAAFVGDKILNFFRRFSNRTIKFTVTGGEPSLIDFKRVFTEKWKEYGKGNKIHLTLISNFSAPNKKYKEFFELLDSYGISHSMTVSLHDNIWANKDYVINKIKEMKGYISCINYVLTDSNKKIIEEYYDALKGITGQRIGVERNGRCEFQISEDTWKFYEKRKSKKQIWYFHDGIKEFRDMDNLIKEVEPENGFKGWTCYPRIRVSDGGIARACNKIIDLEKIQFPFKMICNSKDENSKCAFYRFSKVEKDD